MFVDPVGQMAVKIFIVGAGPKHIGLVADDSIG